MKYAFREAKLSKLNKERLEKINSIIREYQKQRLVLTLRQLYYQLVSREVIPNQQNEYAKLSNLLKEGRMSGVVDWDAIEDRLRVPYKPSSWDSPKDILEGAASQFELPRTKGQKQYIECWVEKDALSGVLRRVTRQYHVPILVNRGYSSASAMYNAYERFFNAFEKNQTVTILYLGDYDPSGIDMIRDIRERTLEFIFGDKHLMNIAEEKTDPVTDEADEEHNRLCQKYEHQKIEILNTEDDYFDSAKAYWYDRFTIEPIALTLKQIKEYKPPPNPAKTTDPRSAKFISELGNKSWEVDALRPEVLNSILEMAIVERLDMILFNEIKAKEQVEKDKIQKIADKWKN